MLKKSCYALSVIVLMACGAGPAMALSIGASINASTGESMVYHEIPFDTKGRNEKYAFIYQDYGYVSSIGGGLVIDDERADGNYIHRYNITMDRYSISKGSQQVLYRFSFVNTFCFVVSKNDYYKFWLGPQIGVRYLFGKTNYNYFDSNPLPNAILYSYYIPVPLLSYKYGKAKYNLAGLDLGLVAGLNVDLKRYVTLSTSGGIRYGATAGGMSFRNGGLFQKNRIAFSHGYEAFVDFSIMYQLDSRQTDKKAG